MRPYALCNSSLLPFWALQRHASTASRLLAAAYRNVRQFLWGPSRIASCWTNRPLEKKQKISSWMGHKCFQASTVASYNVHGRYSGQNSHHIEIGSSRGLLVGFQLDLWSPQLLPIQVVPLRRYLPRLIIEHRCWTSKAFYSLLMLRRWKMSEKYGTLRRNSDCS